MRMTLLLLGLMAGCSEYDLSAKDPGPEEPDSGSTPDVTDPPPPIETGETGDTDPGTVVDKQCPEDSPPGYGGPADDACVNEIETGSFTPVEEWRIGAFSVAPDYNNVMMQPIVASLTDDDGDGDIDEHDTPDVILTSYTGTDWISAGVVRALHGDGSGEIFNLQGTGIQGSGSLAAGDIDGDGIVEIIGVTASGYEVVALEHDGTEKWRSPPTNQSATCYAAAPALADLEGDGDVEIVVGNVVLEHTGAIRFTGAAGHGFCASFPVDLEGDGVLEIIAGNTVYSHTGAIWWTSGYDGHPAVADFDLDGIPEIVLAGDYEVSMREAATGAARWSAPYAGEGPPTIADYDGDGYPEIGVAGTSTYTVLEGDGTQVWQNSTTDGSSGRTGSAVFDFEGDGVAEVVYADEYNVWVFSGVDGSVKLQDTNHTSWTWIEYSVVVDVDGDDQAEIVAPHGQYSSVTSGAFYGISVIGDLDESWMPGRKIWNQHAYHITNVEEDGSIPVVADRNWLSYNNFRSGDLTAGRGVAAPDATLEAEVCETDCDEERLVVWVHPGNIGADAALAGATLDLWVETPAERVRVESRSLPALPEGQFLAAERFEISGWDPTEILTVEAEVRTVEPECDPDNNRLLLAGPFCG